MSRQTKNRSSQSVKKLTTLNCTEAEFASALSQNRRSSRPIQLQVRLSRPSTSERSRTGSFRTNSQLEPENERKDVCIRQTLLSPSPFPELAQILVSFGFSSVYHLGKGQMAPHLSRKSFATTLYESFEELGIRKKVLVGNEFLSYIKLLVRSALPPSFG